MKLFFGYSGGGEKRGRHVQEREIDHEIPDIPLKTAKWECANKTHMRRNTHAYTQIHHEIPDIPPKMEQEQECANSDWLVEEWAPGRYSQKSACVVILQCIAEYCSVLQCVAVRCIVLQPIRAVVISQSNGVVLWHLTISTRGVSARSCQRIGSMTLRGIELLVLAPCICASSGPESPTLPPSPGPCHLPPPAPPG